MLAILRQAGNQVCARRGQERVHARRARSGARQIRRAQKVTVKGTLKGETLTVESVLQRSNSDHYWEHSAQALPAVLRFLLRDMGTHDEGRHRVGHQ